MMARRSPSSVIGVPVVVLMVRMSGSETRKSSRLVAVNLDEILRTGHRQHRLDPFLDAGQLQLPVGASNLTVAVHQASNRRTVDIRDWGEIDQNIAPSG